LAGKCEKTNYIACWHYTVFFYPLKGPGEEVRGGSYGGCSGECSGHGCGRGQNYTGARAMPKSGHCAALGNNVFDYGQRAAADQMPTLWEKLVQFVGTNYRQDISNELQNKISLTLTKQIHTPEVFARHAIWKQMVCTGQEKIHAQQACFLK
jgi:hypothetical protein